MEHLAHIAKDGTKQSLKEHSMHVSILCARYAEIIDCSALGRLIGLLHDMGKATQEFEDYLLISAQNNDSADIKHHNHAPTGAIYAYKRWFNESGTPVVRWTAQIIALCIYGHHTGLMDCVDDKGILNFKKCMEQDKSKLCYEEAVHNFLDTVCSAEELDRMFEDACQDIKRNKNRLTLSEYYDKDKRSKEYFSRREFQLGLLARFMLSSLVDADRWDSACFEYGQDSMLEKQQPDWQVLCDTYERYAEKTFTQTGALNQKRQEISDICAEKANTSTGLYSLSVPTGGGKTFASLRFAMNHAKINKQKRIFYIIPYNTILDQNARDIREALDNYEGILEHHSNVITEKEEETEEEQLAYKHLTERWDSDIILTSMVQFLNALFRKENTNARRMHQLSDSVLIFDEIQALPRKCKGLFERAIMFLTTICHSTVLLCTATQMQFDLPIQPIELIGTEEQIDELNESLKRVTYIPQIEERIDNQEAANRLMDIMRERSSVLMIVNTKTVAWDIYDLAYSRLEEAGYERVEIDLSLTEDEIKQKAKESENFEILCVHLSTLLCPAHRKQYIKWICNWTKAGGRAFCVSTALIEAGINVSFPVVVRSLAGLPSIVQAAGRCNRNKEQALGEVYIWDLADEQRALTKLEEIQHGQECARQIINTSNDELSSPQAIKLYFDKEQKYIEKIERFLCGSDQTLVDLLSNNKHRAKAKVCKSYLRQSFRDAGEKFKVIDESTKPILVPYGAGKELISKLNGTLSMKEEIQLLKKAQIYCVNIYDNMYKHLQEQDALVLLGQSGVIALRDGYYGDDCGVKTERGGLNAMVY